MTNSEPITELSEALAARLREQVTSAETAITREVAGLSTLIETAQSYAPEALIARDFTEAFPPDDDWLNTMRSSIGVGPHVLNGFLIAWDARRLSDVTPRVAWLAKRIGKFEIQDYPELGRRTYDFGRLKFMVFFNAYDAKTVCKFVEVGKEEKPVYKLMCGEDAVSS